MHHSTRRAVRGIGGGLAALAMTAGLALTPAHAAPGKGADPGRLADYVAKAGTVEGASIVPGRYYVAVAGNPTARGGSAVDVKSRQSAVKSAAKAKGLGVRFERSFDRLWNGMTVSASMTDAVQLQSLPGVTAVFPVMNYARPYTPKATKPEMYTAGAMTGANVVQNELGYTGKGIKVGVIDSGIDIDHPDLGGTGTPGTTAFPNTKVAGGWDFVGDAYDAKKNPVLAPDPIPDDCGGHGTHVSGIIAGQGDPATDGVRGVAPDATLYGYRVFGCTGSTDSENVIAALERAGDDGMDVVNLSLGSPYDSWPEYPTAVAVDALADRGTIVVTSAGNEGDTGGMATGAPGVAKKAISTASIDNTDIAAWAFTIAGRPVQFASATGAPDVPTSGTMPLVIGNPLNGCTALDPVPAGSAVLLQRGTCTFRQKALAAQAAGASALVLFNNQPGVISPTVEGDPAITIPVVIISQADGEAVKAVIEANGPATINWSQVISHVKSESPNLASDFTSWGLAADLSLKPDVAAPGGNIWSTLPLEQGTYGPMSGTSMASPHVAGSVALLLEARPELKGNWQAVRDLLQNTAQPERPFSFAPTLGLQEMVTRIGAGLIKTDRAILTEQFASPGKISLGDADTTPASTTVTVTNTSDAPVTYTLSNLDGVGFVGNSAAEFDYLPAQVSMPTSITVPAGGKASFDVAIKAPADAPAGYQYGGWIKLDTDNGTDLSIPYAGMAGDYQSLQVLTNGPTGAPLPALGRVVDDELQLVDPGEPKVVYTMKDGDVPVLLFHLEYPVEIVRAQVYAANADGSKGALLGTIADEQKIGRDNEYVQLSWDGSFVDSLVKKNGKTSVKAGSYIIELSVLKALGDPANPAHWETWTSPVFATKSASAGTNPSRFKNRQVEPLA